MNPPPPFDSSAACAAGASPALWNPLYGAPAFLHPALAVVDGGMTATMPLVEQGDGGALSVAEVAEREKAAQEKEQRKMRRKQANRESARRSKLKRKSEAQTLVEHAKTVEDEHQRCKSGAESAQQRLYELQVLNSQLQSEIRSFAAGNGGAT